VRLRQIAVVLVLSLLFIPRMATQSPNATISGLVIDPSGGVIVGAEILAINDATGVQTPSKTNGEGIYVVRNLPPGTYRLQVSKVGFKTLIKPDIILNVQDALAINFTLPVGAASETVTVEAGAPLLDTESTSVSTVVDRQFAENLPMNGRSFQTLIELTPGVVAIPSNPVDGGQFSVNGQRGVSNYWMVDGVSANIGVSASAAAGPGNGFAGTLPSFSVLGGTNSLVSVDAMQEFRIQTSTYAPEFGRTPGAQVSIVTRSGANQFHGVAFDYLRNSVLDANNWFADSAGLPKPAEIQNDFGGTFSGPIARDRTFFFFSYEGLRLRLPQTELTTVPDLAARQSAIPALQPYLNAYPQPNGSDNLATGVAQFNASFSNPATLDAYSLRIDHKLSERLNLFGRYNYSPSNIVQRGTSTIYPLSDVQTSKITTQTATAGLTWNVSPSKTNDFRFNYSQTTGSTDLRLDNFGGATPLASLPFPSPFTAQNGLFIFGVASLVNGHLEIGKGAYNLQRQINLIDSISVQVGSHNLKFGADYRLLLPSREPFLYLQSPFFLSVPAAESGKALFTEVSSQRSSSFQFQNFGAFAQDTWRVTPRLTVTYGLRWDLDFAPVSTEGPNFPAVVNFNDLPNLALAPMGTPPFKTTYGNVAPRVGIAYHALRKNDWGLVARGGFGVFYDLVTSEAGNLFALSYPFAAAVPNFFMPFPLNSAAAAPPPITTAQLSSPTGVLTAFNPHLQLPYTLEWNVALEQQLGKAQTISLSYLGSAGRRLLQTGDISTPNATFGSALLVGNTATSDYNALQIQFQRRLSRGLQALASYTWSHSIDDGSAGSPTISSNAFVPMVNPNANRGPSDFDIRSSFSTGVTYDIPTSSKLNAFAKTILGGWSTENFVLARTALPINVYDGLLALLFNGATEVRPDVVPGIPLYLYGPQYPGGKILNNTPNAGGPGCVGPFCPPPTDVNGNPLRQGNLGRNALRGFPAAQWDFAIHREFPLHESVKLQFRAEMFNVLNHPNFAPPVADLSQPNFGLATQTLNQYLGGNLGAGGFNSLYQIGGPRSVQFALKLMF